MNISTTGWLNIHESRRTKTESFRVNSLRRSGSRSNMFRWKANVRDKSRQRDREKNIRISKFPNVQLSIHEIIRSFLTFQTLKFELSVLKLIVENSSLRLCTLTLHVNAWSHKTQHPYLLKNRIYYPCFAANFQLPSRVCNVTPERPVSIHFTPSRFGKTWPRQNFMGRLIVARH